MHKKSKSARTERTERTARAAQAEILAAIQQTGNNVAEVMNSLQALGAKFGINVNFTLGNRKSGTNRTNRGIETHGRHSEHGEHQTQTQTQRNRQISKVLQDKEDKAQEVTIPELAAMVSDELGMNEDCALDALETAFELMERYSLILDIGDIGILAGHEVNEVNELHDDSCEAYNPCKACENFNNCGYCNWDEDEDTCEDSYDCDDFDSDKE